MMLGNNCQFDKEEIIEPKSKKATKKRKTTAMLLNEQNKRLCKLEKQLKYFCEKWEWLDLEDADKTLSESEQKIWEIIQKNQDLEKQVAEKDKLINEYADEHAMLQCKIADLAVKEIKAEDFAIDILEELDGCSNYINSKLDFECGFYISQKTIRDKIKELRGQE